VTLPLFRLAVTIYLYASSFYSSVSRHVCLEVWANELIGSTIIHNMSRWKERGIFKSVGKYVSRFPSCSPETDKPTQRSHTSTPITSSPHPSRAPRRLQNRRRNLHQQYLDGMSRHFHPRHPPLRHATNVANRILISGWRISGALEYGNGGWYFRDYAGYAGGCECGCEDGVGCDGEFDYIWEG